MGAKGGGINDAVRRERYYRFRAELPGLCRALHVRPSELQFVELRSMMLGWLTPASLP
jgi:hypothetical protein